MKLTKHKLVAQLETRLLTEFESFAKRINSEFPHVRANVQSRSIGQGEYLGHNVGIDCLLLDPASEPDNVALMVELHGLAKVPTISADVVWGHPSGYVEADFPVDWFGQSSELPEATDATVEETVEAIPRLYEALLTALNRGRPDKE